MNNIMEYKGYVGSVEFSEKDGLFFGKVQGLRPIISYEGTNADDLLLDFHEAVDQYLALCDKEGSKPETAYKGSLNVRFKNSDIHRRAAIYAMMHEQSLNSFIEEAVEEKLSLIGDRTASLDTARVFSSGRSQAVQLPESCFLMDDEVFINRIGDLIVLVPKKDRWKNLIASLSQFTDDFLNEEIPALPLDEREVIV